MSEYSRNFDFNLSQISTELSDDEFSFGEQQKKRELDWAIEMYKGFERVRNRLAQSLDQARNNSRPPLDTLEQVMTAHRILEQDLAGLLELNDQVLKKAKSPQLIAQQEQHQRNPSQERSRSARKQGPNQQLPPKDPMNQFQDQQDDQPDSRSADPNRNHNLLKEPRSQRKYAFHQSSSNTQPLQQILFVDKSINEITSEREVTVPKFNPKQQEEASRLYQKVQQEDLNQNDDKQQGQIRMEGYQCVRCKSKCRCFP